MNDGWWMLSDSKILTVMDQKNAGPAINLALHRVRDIVLLS